MTSHAFISYVREDLAAVTRLAEELKAGGIDVWLDKNKILPGTPWRQAIREAIGSGSFFLACFSSSQAARTRGYMHEDLCLAIEEVRKMPESRRWLIPVRLSDCSIPDIEIHPGLRLGDLHYADLSNEWGDEVAKLIQAMDGDLHAYSQKTAADERSGEPTPLDAGHPSENHSDFLRHLSSEMHEPLNQARQIRHIMNAAWYDVTSRHRLWETDYRLDSSVREEFYDVVTQSLADYLVRERGLPKDLLVTSDRYNLLNGFFDLDCLEFRSLLSAAARLDDANFSRLVADRVFRYSVSVKLRGKVSALIEQHGADTTRQGCYAACDRLGLDRPDGRKLVTREQIAGCLSALYLYSSGIWTTGGPQRYALINRDFGDDWRALVPPIEGRT